MPCLASWLQDPCCYWLIWSTPKALDNCIMVLVLPSLNKAPGKVFLIDNSSWYCHCRYSIDKPLPLYQFSLWGWWQIQATNPPPKARLPAEGWPPASLRDPMRQFSVHFQCIFQKCPRCIQNALPASPNPYKFSFFRTPSSPNLSKHLLEFEALVKRV